MSVSTGVDGPAPPKTTPGSTPFRRRAPTFFPNTTRGRTVSFWASATTNRSPDAFCGNQILAHGGGGKSRQARKRPGAPWSFWDGERGGPAAHASTTFKYPSRFTSFVSGGEASFT